MQSSFQMLFYTREGFTVFVEEKNICLFKELYHK